MAGGSPQEQVQNWPRGKGEEGEYGIHSYLHANGSIIRYFFQCKYVLACRLT